MKAAVVTAFGAPLQVEEVSVPQPGPGQILVRMEASGLCHTDIHAARGDWPVKPTPPFIPGHEGIGVFEAMGPGVTGRHVGQRVSIAWLCSAWSLLNDPVADEDSTRDATDGAGPNLIGGGPSIVARGISCGDRPALRTTSTAVSTRARSASVSGVPSLGLFLARIRRTGSSVRALTIWARRMAFSPSTPRP